MDGPGGSGKSYLFNTIIRYMNSIDVKMLVVAWTGIAASLLTNGKTIHTTFYLTLDINESTTCNYKQLGRGPCNYEY